MNYLNSKVRITLFSIIPLVFDACLSDTKQPIEYIQWIQDKKNGLLIEQDIDPYIFKLQYKPIEYMGLIETKGEQLVDTVFRKVVENYRDMEYYDLVIALKNSNKEIMREGISSPADYFQKVDYLSFQMQSRFTLIAGQDTLPCKLYHFERNYNTSPQSHFSLGFDVPKDIKSNRKLIYDDEILGISDIELEVKGMSIVKIPALKYSF